jgi:Flp pilus assembly protein TadG
MIPRNRTWRRRSVRRGNALLDAALVLPILLSLTFGTVEYGYFFFVKHSLQGAAREGCRAAIVPSATNTTVTQAIATSLQAAGLNSSGTSLDPKFSLTLSPANVSGLSAGTSVTVQLDATWGTVGVRPLGLIAADKVVRGSTVMRKEG